MEEKRFEDLDSISEMDIKRLAKMLLLSRAESGLSQEAVALELGISKKTVQNWEKGASTPTLPQAIAWFHVVKVAAMPYFLQFMFPDMEGICSQSDISDIRKNLTSLIEVMPEDGIRQLMYLFYGNHGSSPKAALNMITAYLQIPLIDRYQLDCQLLENYRLAQDLNTITKSNHVQPNVKLMEKTVSREREAIVKQDDNYMLV